MINNIITLRTKLRGTEYCYRSCMQRPGGRAMCVCGFVGLLSR